MQIVKPQIAGHLNAPYDNRLDMVKDALETHHGRRGCHGVRSPPLLFRVPTLFVMEGGYAVAEIGINTVNVLTGFENG